MAGQYLVHSKGIYHGLPDLSGAGKGLTAIVTGANGISGAHLVFLSVTPFSVPLFAIPTCLQVVYVRLKAFKFIIN